MCPSLRLLCSINKLVGITLPMCQAFFLLEQRSSDYLIWKTSSLKKFWVRLFIFNKKVCLILYSSEAFLSDEESDDEKALEVS